MSTAEEQDTVTWTEFETRFDTMFMPETSRMAKSYELDSLVQGTMTVDAYEQRFRELCQYAPVEISETRRCRLFEKGLRDEIRSAVAASMFSVYARCVESARSVEMTAPKPKPRDTSVVAPKAKVEESTKDGKSWHKDGKKPWHRDGKDHGIPP